MARLLLDAGANIHSASNGFSSRLGLQIIHLAASYGNEPLLQLLIDRGADVNAKTGNDATPYVIAKKILSQRGDGLSCQSQSLIQDWRLQQQQFRYHPDNNRKTLLF